AAAKENRIELVEESTKVKVRIHDDPIRFALRPCDEAVQTCGNHVANPSHVNLRRCSFVRLSQTVIEAWPPAKLQDEMYDQFDADEGEPAEPPGMPNDGRNWPSAIAVSAMPSFTSSRHPT